MTKVLFYRSLSTPFEEADKKMLQEQGIVFHGEPPDRFEVLAAPLVLGVHLSQPQEGHNNVIPQGALRAVIAALMGAPCPQSGYDRHYRWAQGHSANITTLWIVSGGGDAHRVVDNYKLQLSAVRPDIALLGGTPNLFINYESDTEPADAETIKALVGRALHDCLPEKLGVLKKQIRRLEHELLRRGYGEYADQLAVATSVDEYRTLLNRLHAGIEETSSLSATDSAMPSLSGLSIHIVKSGGISRRLSEAFRLAGATVQDDRTAADAAKRIADDDPQHVLVCNINETMHDDATIQSLVTAARAKNVFTVAWTKDAPRDGWDFLWQANDYPVEDDVRRLFIRLSEVRSTARPGEEVLVLRLFGGDEENGENCTYAELMIKGASGKQELPYLDEVARIKDIWGASREAVVDARACSDDFIEVLRHLWARKIVPTILVLAHTQQENKKLLGLFRSVPGCLHVITTEHPIAPEVLDRRIERLRPVLRDVAADPAVQKKWTEDAQADLERYYSHRNVARLGAKRFLRGSRQGGYLTKEEYASLARRVFATRDLADLSESQETKGRPPEKWRVLIIDDEPYWADLIRPVLASEGIGVEGITTVRQGLDRLEFAASQFAAVLLDLHFEYETEWSPTRLVRRVIEIAPQIPVIVFSTEIDGRIVQEIARDAFGYFFKEFEPVGQADTVGHVQRFIETIRGAIQNGGVFAAKSLAQWIKAPEPAGTFITLQAQYLGSPRLAMTLNVGMFVLIEETTGPARPLRRRFRNYGAHVDVEREPTIYEALASWLLWLDRFIEQAKREEFEQRLAMLCKCFGRSDDRLFLDMENLLGISREDRVRQINGLRRRITPEKIAERFPQAVQSLRYPGTESTAAADEVLVLAHQTNPAELSTAEQIAQGLLLRRLIERCK